jgi:hypothetical protein
VYASASNVCSLVKASTLARYAPGATVNTQGLLDSECDWDAQGGTLFMEVGIFDNADSALGQYQTDIQADRKSQFGITFQGTQPVKGLGDQAIAIFQSFDGSPGVEMEALAGNAEIEMTFTDVTLTPAEQVTAETAMIRDVLADLPR